MVPLPDPKETDSAHTGGEPTEAPILRIGQVANIVGVSTSRIRLWEHEKLIVPQRTASGQRQYSMQDVKRLEKILRLLETKSMTMIGIRNALESTSTEPSNSLATPDPAGQIGQRVKLLRQSRRMSLRGLAAEIGLSPSALSAFERGVSKPSIGRISQIAHALDATVPGLLGMPPVKAQMVVRSADRQVLPLEAEGVKIENLYLSSTTLQSQMVTVYPGCGSGDPMTHAGEEFLTVIEGGIDVVLDSFETVHLSAGDSMTFASTRAHSYHNHGDITSRIVWVNTPPTF